MTTTIITKNTIINKYYLQLTTLKVNVSYRLFIKLFPIYKVLLDNFGFIISLDNILLMWEMVLEDHTEILENEKGYVYKKLAGAIKVRISLILDMMKHLSDVLDNRRSVALLPIPLPRFQNASRYRLVTLRSILEKKGARPLKLSSFLESERSRPLASERRIRPMAIPIPPVFPLDFSDDLTRRGIFKVTRRSMPNPIRIPRIPRLLLAPPTGPEPLSSIIVPTMEIENLQEVLEHYNSFVAEYDLRHKYEYDSNSVLYERETILRTYRLTYTKSIPSIVPPYTHTLSGVLLPPERRYEYAMYFMRTFVNGSKIVSEFVRERDPLVKPIQKVDRKALLREAMLAADKAYFASFALEPEPIVIQSEPTVIKSKLKVIQPKLEPIPVLIPEPEVEPITIELEPIVIQPESKPIVLKKKKQEDRSEFIENKEIVINKPSLKGKVLQIKEALRQSYYEEGFRYELGVLAQLPPMKFLRPSIGTLDSIFNEFVFDGKEEVGSQFLSKENALMINGESYFISDKHWDTIFGKLLFGESKFTSREWTENSNLKLLFESIVSQMILSDGSESNHVSYKMLNDFSFTTGNGDCSDKAYKSIDKFIYKEIQLVFQTLYRNDSYSNFYSKGSSKETKSANDYIFSKTVDILKQKLLATFEACYQRTVQRYNPEYRIGDDVRLPYSTLAKMLGDIVCTQLLFIFPNGFESFIKDNKNPIISNWLRDPNIGHTKKPLDKTLNTQFLRELGFTDKELNFIVRFVCTLYYDWFYSIKGHATQKPLIAQLLNKNIKPHIDKLYAYIESHKVKYGSTLISILVRTGIIKDTPLYDYANTLTDRKRNKDQLIKANYQKVRVAVISAQVASAFISSSQLNKPYLTKKSIRKDLPIISPQDKYSYIVYRYFKQCKNRIHENENTEGVLLDRVALGKDEPLLIDQFSLHSLLTIIAKCNEVEPGLLLEPSAEDSFYTLIVSIPDYDDNIFFDSLLSIFNINPDSLRKLRIKSFDDYNTVIMIKEIMRNMSLKDSKITRKYIEASRLITKEKDYYYQILNKIDGIKYSLIALINDAIIYSHFKSFRIPSFLDTRGRVYLKATNLNIQGAGINKTIVKLAQYPITKTINETQYVQIIDVIRDYAQTLPLNPETIKAWLHKYGFDNPNNHTIEKLESFTEKARISQLSKYLDVSGKIEARTIIAKLGCLFAYDYDNYKPFLTALLPLLKQKKKLLIAYDILRSIYQGRSKRPTILRHRPYPYELDATASGIQMTALMLNCPNLAQWCGLLYKKQVDLYKEVAQQFNADVKETLNYIIPPFNDNDKDNDNLCTYIPQKYHWLIASAENKPHTVKEYINLFKRVQQEKLNLIRDYPDAYKLLNAREPWKKNIMTFAYNSSSKGRVVASTQYIRDNIPHPMDLKIIEKFAQFMEDYFRFVAQPTFIPTAMKIRAISKIIASNANPADDKSNKPDNDKSNKPDNDKTIIQRECIIETQYIRHTINPKVKYTHKMTNTSQKGKNRGYQINLQMNKYDKQGNPILNYTKINLLLGPNLMHICDANLIHRNFHAIKFLNTRFHELNIFYKFRQMTTHDNLASTDPFMMKPLYELSYLELNHFGPINMLKNNRNYDKILEIVNPNYIFPDRNKRRKSKNTKSMLLPYHAPVINDRTALELKQLAQFVK